MQGRGKEMWRYENDLYIFIYYYQCLICRPFHRERLCTISEGSPFKWSFLLSIASHIPWHSAAAEDRQDDRSFPCMGVVFFSFTCSSPVCLWVWQQQQSGTPDSDQLITHLLCLPGLSTTSALDYHVPDGDNTMPILVFSWNVVFHISGFFDFSLIPLSVLAQAELSSAVLLCFLLACTP